MQTIKLHCIILNPTPTPYHLKVKFLIIIGKIQEYRLLRVALLIKSLEKKILDKYISIR